MFFSKYKIERITDKVKMNKNIPLRKNQCLRKVNHKNSIESQKKKRNGCTRKGATIKNVNHKYSTNQLFYAIQNLLAASEAHQLHAYERYKTLK